MALTPTLLQTPEWAYYNGSVRPYSEAVLHISSEAVVRGLNVFEGLKGFWQPDGEFGILALERHWARMRRSALLLSIPFDMSLKQWITAHHSIVERLYEPSRQMWMRSTLYVIEGHWGENQKSDLVITAYHRDKGMPPAMATGVSTWRRASDDSVPYRIKTSTNYQVARLAKLEGRERGYAEMVLLNQHGRVAESIGSAILVARGGEVLTPPCWEGAIESITVEILEALARDLGIPFTRRPIDRTELMIADEIAFVGTLNDVTPISSLDGRLLSEQRVLKRLAMRYLAACEGREPHPAVDLSIRSQRVPTG